MNRRLFLKGIGAVAAAVVVPASTLTRGKFDGTGTKRCDFDLSFYEEGGIPPMMWLPGEEPVYLDNGGMLMPEQSRAFVYRLTRTPASVTGEPIGFVTTPWKMGDLVECARERGVI